MKFNVEKKHCRQQSININFKYPFLLSGFGTFQREGPFFLQGYDLYVGM